MTETAFQAAIPAAVGDSYDPTTKDYIVVRHAQVGFKVLYGWQCCGETQDSTMVVMEKPK